MINRIILCHMSVTKPTFITMKQLAKLAGVSQSLVSRALHGGGASTIGVSPETAARIRELAALHGYRANAAARATRRRKLATIALLLSTERRRSYLPSQLLDGIQDALFEHDLRLLLARLPDEQLTDERYVPYILREWAADGVLVNYTDHIPVPMLELIRKHNIPSVWLNCRLPADCVHPDDYGAGRRATEHLLALGHRRIAYVDYTHSRSSSALHYSAIDRQAGYEHALRAAGLTPETFWPDQAVPATERVTVSWQWLHRAELPTAVVTYSYREAGALLHAATLHGRRVPRDLSIVSFGPEEIQGAGLVLTQFILPEHALGNAAVAMLVKKIATPVFRQPTQALPFGFVEGQTCARPGAEHG